MISDELVQRAGSQCIGIIDMVSIIIDLLGVFTQIVQVLYTSGPIIVTIGSQSGIGHNEHGEFELSLIRIGYTVCRFCGVLKSGIVSVNTGIVVTESLLGP